MSTSARVSCRINNYNYRNRSTVAPLGNFRKLGFVNTAPIVDYNRNL